MAENLNGPRKRRRQPRQVTACCVCRRRRVACDRKHPCQTCVSSNCAEECSYERYEDDRDNSTHMAATQEVKNVPHADGNVARPASTEARLDRIERLVHRVAAQIEDFTRVLSTAPSLNLGANGSRIYAVSDNYYAKAILNCDKVKGAVFHIGSHHFVKPLSQDMAYLRSPGNHFAQQWLDLQALSTQFVPNRRSTLLDFAIVKTEVPESSLTLDELTAALPEKAVCNAATSRFLSTFNLTHPVLHEEDLLVEIDSFWHGKSSSVSKSWLNLYLAVISLGLHLPSADAGSCSSESFPNGRLKAEHLMGLSRTNVLFLAREASRPSITLFQTIILVILYQKLALDWIDGNDMTNGLLGVLSRMAVTMGLHRDPSESTDLSSNEKELRQAVFWTFTFIDLEHSLQCGTPFQSSQQDPDVSVCRMSTRGWPGYSRCLGPTLPLCMQVLQTSHTMRAAANSGRIVDIKEELSQLFNFTLREGRSGLDELLTGRALSLQEKLVVFTQQALVLSLNRRLQGLIDYPFLEAAEESIRLSAAEAILEVCERILSFGVELDTLIAELPSKRDRDRWIHFVASLLRCQLYWASSASLLVLRRRNCHASFRIQKNRARQLLPAVETVLNMLGHTLPISFESSKQQAVYMAQYHSVKEDLYHIDESAEAMCATQLDPDTPRSRFVVLATQQTMDSVIQKALIAIGEARKFDDPPPNLLLSSRNSIQSSMNQANGIVQTNENSDFQISECLFAFDESFSGMAAAAENTWTWNAAHVALS